jgi:peptidyl-prolyl cis-trans isomerase A (cyclophilin A)
MTKAVIAAALAAAIISGVAAASGGPSLLHPASLHAKAPATFKARFETTKGTFVVKVTRKWAPKGADRFYNLVKYHFYDNQPLFRVELKPKPFVVQWGISMKPPIAKVWQKATIKDDPVTHTNAKGTITFATAGPNTRTTQLFVNLANNSFLNGEGFSPFGTVTSGFSVFSQLYHGKQSAEATRDQAGLTNFGAKYVRKHYPKLDWIKTARLVHSG